MGGDRTLVHDLHFKIFGDGFTRTFRALMMEGNWRGAFRVVNDGLIGISYEQSVAALNGDYVFTGCSDTGLVMDKEDKKSEDYVEYRAQLAWMYGDIVMLSADSWYRPYAFVSSYGPRDLGGADDANGNRHIGIEHHSRSTRRFSDYDYKRMSYYARNPVTDKIKVLNYAKLPTYTGCILFERCDPPPMWWESPPSPQAAVDTCAQLNKHLDEYGCHINEGEGNFAWPPELPEDIEQDRNNELISMRADIRDGREPQPPQHEPSMQQRMAMDMAVAIPGMDISKAVSAVDAIMGDGKELDEVPEQDSDLEGECGYIIPDGRFYSCGYMKHRMLCYRIFVYILERKDVAQSEITEQLADDEGWVRVQQSMSMGTAADNTVIHIPCTLKADQRRTLKAWCDKHHVEYPEEEDGNVYARVTCAGCEGVFNPLLHDECPECGKVRL